MSALGQTNYMSKEYIEQWGHEPQVAQKAERERMAHAQSAIEAEIKRVYPKWATKPITMQMKSGVKVTTGFDNVFAAICAGRAELVHP